MFLPQSIEKVLVPPIKCQGIKTKLVGFIARSIKWDGRGRWIEPFLGSGSLLFNIKPHKALVSDSNRHIIKFYKDLQSNKIDENKVRDFLTEKGQLLAQKGANYYYSIRVNFNRAPDSLLFLFLNRSCFNGLMRFNSRGYFNVPFCQKDERFSQSYITKIVNQVARVKEIIRGNDWQFQVSDWQRILSEANSRDFIYLDPPYIGRNADYFNRWTNDDAIGLSKAVKLLPCGYALSMWKENRYRKNRHLPVYWGGLRVKKFNHFYHIGSKVSLRNSITEALVIKPEFSVVENGRA